MTTAFSVADDPIPELFQEPPHHDKLKDARLRVDPESKQPYLIQDDREDGKIRVLKINRLKARNGFDDWLYLVISDALNVAAADEKVLVVVLTGEGEVSESQPCFFIQSN